MTDSQLYGRRAGNETGSDRWLTANMAFGAIVAIGLVAMALTGSMDSGAAKRPQTASSTAEASSIASVVMGDPSH